MMTGAAVAIVAMLAPAACSTEEHVRLADGGCVAGGCQGIGGFSSIAAGGSCTPDASCAVSFKNDIFPSIIDGTAGCTANGCHAAGTANANLELNPGQAAAAYTELLNYALNKPVGAGGPYIAPCFPAGSKLLCNLAVMGTNPYSPCGTVMPVGKKLSQAEFDQISEWISCGAPDN